VSDVRRANIRLLIEAQGRGGLSKLSRALEMKNPSFLSQMVGPNPTRDVTEKLARRIEKATGLVEGALDKPNGATKPVTAQPQPTQAATSNTSVDLVANVIRLVGEAYEAESAPLAPAKFSDLVALVLVESMERGRAPQPEKVRALVRLTK
jgi:hypothetical protein